MGHFGSLIDYFLSKGSRVFLYCDNSHDKRQQGYKAYLYPDADLIRSIFPSAEVVVYTTESELVSSVGNFSIEVMFLLAFDGVAERLCGVGISKDDLLIASIQTGFDLLSRKKSFCDDVVYLFSPLWRDCWKASLLHSGVSDTSLLDDIDEKTAIVGFPQLDQAKSLNREKICAKYGIPVESKILVYLPFPWRVPFCKWSHIFYKPQSRFLKIARLLLRGDFASVLNVFKAADDRQLAHVIREFSDSNDAFFIVKARAKNNIPSYLTAVADRVIFDESYHPYTIMELLSVADLCIHFYSDAVKESVALGVPSICLGPASPSDWHCYASRFFMPAFSPDPGSYYNFDSVVYNESVEAFVASFADKVFSDYRISPVRQRVFAERYLGYNDFNSCERVYDDICRRLSLERV